MNKYLIKYQIRNNSPTKILVESNNRKGAVQAFFNNIASCFYDQCGSLTMLEIIDLSKVKEIKADV